MNDYLLPPGKVLKMYLTHNKTTQKQLAWETGMTQSYISEVIHGKAKITPYFAVRLETVYGFNTAEFWLDLEKHYQIKSERRKRYEWKKQKENESVI